MGIDAEHVVVRGSLVVVGTDGLGFAAVRRRLHPSPTLLEGLARSAPATLAITDLTHGSTDLRRLPLADRRRALERLAEELSIPIAPSNLRRIAPATPLVISPRPSTGRRRARGSMTATPPAATG